MIRIRADRITRWREGDASLTDLRGNAQIFQGLTFVRASRLFVRFTQIKKDGRTAGFLEVYGTAGTRYQNESKATTAGRPLVFHLTTSAGIVLEGETAFGYAPPEDGFLHHARTVLNSKPGTALPAELPDDFFGEVRPSAEEMAMVDLTDEGVTITLRGNARVAARDFLLSADAIRIRVGFRGGRFKSPLLLSIYAEGVVDLNRAEQRITASALYLDAIEEEGLALDARVRVVAPDLDVPAQVYADVVRQTSRYRFTCEGPGFFSTSQFARPHYRIEGKKLEMVRGPGWHRWRERDEVREKADTDEAGKPAAPESVVVSSRSNVVYVESLPVFYWPYIAKDVTTGAFLLRSLEVGDSSNLGTFVKAGWNLYDLGLLYNEWSELTLRTDFYSERGAGLGLDFEYEGDKRHGFARVYYIRDGADEDDRNLPNRMKSRGEITWRHREELPYDITADVELGRVSDRNFLRTYDREEYDEAKDRETTIFLSRADENQLITAQSKVRVNHFQNAVDRQSAAYHVIGEPLFYTPFLWTSHNEVAHLPLRTDDALNLPGTNSVARMDTAHELSRPFQAGPVRFDPYLWGDLTFFSDQANRSDGVVRGATAAGTRAASNFYRTYDVQNERLGIDRLRHVITPTAEYENLWGVSKSSSRLIQQDETDAVDKQHRLSTGLHNRLQTHRYVKGRRQTIDFLTFDLDYVFRFNNPRYEGPDDDTVESNLRWEFNENITFASTDNKFNVNRGKIERLNGAITLDYWRPFEVTFSQDYYADSEAARRWKHLVSRVTVSYQPVYSRWRVDFSTGYDFRARRQPGDTKDPKRLGTSLFFCRQLDDWELKFGGDFHLGRASETKLTVKLVAPGRTETERSFR